jgi:hypothetical protein
VKSSLKILSAALLAGCAAIAQPVLAGQVADHVLPEGWTLSGSNPANYDIGIQTVPGAPGKSVFIKWRMPDEARDFLADQGGVVQFPAPPAPAALPVTEQGRTKAEARAKTNGRSFDRLRTFRVFVGGYVTVLQTISADAYIGKRLQLSAMLKTQDADGAQLWMRMDGDDPNPMKNVLNFYNMDDRPITGTTDWARYNVVLDVPDKTKVIAFGFMLKGRGEIWANGVKLEEVGKNVRASATPNNPLPKAPVNLNFDR